MGLIEKATMKYLRSLAAIAFAALFWAATGLAGEVENNVPGLPVVPTNILYASYRVTTNIEFHIILDRPNAEFHHGAARGSCTAYDDHHVLTAAHVVTTDMPDFFTDVSITGITVDVYDTDGDYVRSIDATVGKIDQHVDLAILTTEAALPCSKPLVFGDFKVGNWAYIVGAAHGYSPFNVYWGMLAGRKVDVSDLAAPSDPTLHSTLGQMACTAAPGCSGGGVYTADGKFLGVLTRGENTCIALFVTTEDVKTFLGVK